MPEPTTSEAASPVTTEDQVIRERVKGLTSQALQEGRIDPEAVRDIARAVIGGTAGNMAVSGAETRELFESFRRERGNIPNMFRTMALRPEIAETAAAHMRAVFSTGTVETRLKEMLAVRVSQINDCAY